MSIKLGKVRNGRETITWKKWVKEHFDNNKEYNFAVKTLFLPDKYETYSVILTSQQFEFDVRRTLQPDIGAELEKAVRACGDGEVVVVTVRNGEVEADIQANDRLSDWYYDVQRWGYILKKRQFDNDVPF